MLSLVHAATYELAVHGLDLAPVRRPRPARPLLDRGLASLVDVTGALASKAGVHLVLTASTPDERLALPQRRRAAGTPSRPPAGRSTGVGVSGTAADLLDASAGRVVGADACW